MTIEIPNDAPVYVRIAADIASHADAFRLGRRSAMDAACRRELSAEQTESVEHAVMASENPTRTAFYAVMAILQPA